MLLVQNDSRTGKCTNHGILLPLAQGLSQYPTAVLRVLSESAALRHLPANTILYEEYTRADLQLLLLSGVVEVRVVLRAAAAHLLSGNCGAPGCGLLDLNP